jgi:hypothetical protein
MPWRRGPAESLRNYPENPNAFSASARRSRKAMNCGVGRRSSPDRTRAWDRSHASRQSAGVGPACEVGSSAAGDKPVEVLLEVIVSAKHRGGRTLENGFEQRLSVEVEASHLNLALDMRPLAVARTLPFPGSTRDDGEPAVAPELLLRPKAMRRDDERYDLSCPHVAQANRHAPTCACENLRDSAHQPSQRMARGRCPGGGGRTALPGNDTEASAIRAAAWQPQRDVTTSRWTGREGARLCTRGPSGRAQALGPHRRP